MLQPYFSTIHCEEESISLKFETPLAVLKHLQHTGVNCANKTSVSAIRHFKETTLTYQAGYFICAK